MLENKMLTNFLNPLVDLVDILTKRLYPRKNAENVDLDCNDDFPKKVIPQFLQCLSIVINDRRFTKRFPE